MAPTTTTAAPPIVVPAPITPITDLPSAQARLNALGYPAGAPDGSTGQNTTRALKAFQAAQGLAVTAQLDAATAMKLAAPGPVAPLTGDVTPTRIEISLSRQLLLAWRDGTLVVATAVSSGKSSTPTITGNFTVQSAIGGWERTEVGAMVFKPLWFSGNYGIHGFSSVPDYPASHGCVRVTMPTADALYASFPVGTPVIVVA